MPVCFEVVHDGGPGVVVEDTARRCSPPVAQRLGAFPERVLAAVVSTAPLAAAVRRRRARR